MKKNNLICLIAITTLGFFLRLHNLGGASLWFDELWTVNKLKFSTIQMIESVSVTAATPLYYLLLKPWVRVFGYSEFSLRFPSLIFSTLSIILIYKLSKELFGSKVGIYSALFLSVSPYSIYYAQEAKWYSLFWCLGILSFLYFLRYVKDPKSHSLLPYVIFTTASIYTMYVGLLFIATQNLLFFLFFKIKQSKKWLLAQLTLFLVYIPWMGVFLSTFYHRRGIKWISETHTYSEVLNYGFTRAMVGVVDNIAPIDLYIFYFLILSAIVISRNTKQKKYKISFTREKYLLIAWITVPLLACWLINTLAYPLLSERTTRFIGYVHIPLIILISKGINRYNIKFKTALLILLLLIIIPYRLYPLYQYEYRVLHHDNWRGLSDALHKRTGNSTLILTKLPVNMVGYYNEGYEIRPLKYIDRGLVDKNYDSIFVVYRFRQTIDKEHLRKKFSGHVLEENYFKHPIGFLWFKRVQ